MVRPGGFRRCVAWKSRKQTETDRQSSRGSTASSVAVPVVLDGQTSRRPVGAMPEKAAQQHSAVPWFALMLAVASKLAEQFASGDDTT